MYIVLKFCLFFIFVSAAVALFTYSFFWYENAGTPRRGVHDASSKSLTALMLRGVLTGFASLLMVFATYPLGFIPGIRRPKEVAPSQPVIILTHGLYHNASAWLLMRHRLRKAGFVNIFVMNYRCFFTSFESVLAKFDKFVAASRAAVPDQPLILVGHSLGGLISRVYGERSSGENIPEVVITLGTPHRGSKMAAFALGGLGRSIIYEAPLLRDIEREGRRLPCKGISLISPADSLVLPSESLLAPYPGWTEHETEPVSHVAMLYSKRIAGQLIDLIKQ